MGLGAGAKRLEDGVVADVLTEGVPKMKLLFTLLKMSCAMSVGIPVSVMLAK